MSRGECPLDSCLVLSLRHEGDEGAEGDERGKGHRAGEEGIAILLGGNFPNGAAQEGLTNRSRIGRSAASAKQRVGRSRAFPTAAPPSSHHSAGQSRGQTHRRH